MRYRMLLLSGIAILLAATLAGAADEPSASARQAEIRESIAALQKGFNRGDAKALADCWTPDGEFVGPRGERIVGREKIEAAFGEFLAAHQDSKLRLEISSLRQVADDVVLVDLITEMTPIPDGLESEPASIMLLVKRDGRWLIGSMREVHRSGPAPHVRLKNLAWMVGDWVEQNAGDLGAASRSSCHWTANGSYLIRKFSVEGNNRVVLAGTEVIGWDPRAHRIRSWTFDSDGGFGETAWTRDGNRWILEHTGTLADGGDVSATHVVALLDADTITLESKDRTLAGQRQPDLAKVTFKRRPARDASPSQPNEPVRQVLP